MITLIPLKNRFTTSLALTLFALSSLTHAAKPKTTAPLTRKPAQSETKDLNLLTAFSWNILNYGDKKVSKLRSFNAEQKLDILQRMGTVFRDADIIAFQEVNTQNFRPALRYLRASLQAADDTDTLCLAFSNPSQENPNEVERFAFVWRNSRIHYVSTKGAEVDCAKNPEMDINTPLLESVENQMGRPPTYALFNFLPKQQKFFYVNLHLRPDKKHPQLEIPPLAQGLTRRQVPLKDDPQIALRNKNFPVIVSGDFNFGSKSSAFKPLVQAGFTKALDNEKTSLHRDTRALNQPYDNFWYRPADDEPMKVVFAAVHNLFDIFPEIIKPQLIFGNISDHSPIEARFQFGADEAH